MKFGKLPAVKHASTIRLSPLVKALPSPPVPASADWCSKVTSWPMDGNDTIGDCTVAAAAHMIQAWTTYAGAPVVPAEADVLAAYSAISGYNGTPETDVGCRLLDVLNYWKNTGIAGHKIDDFFAVDITNVEEMKLVIDLFGGMYTGLLLPQSAEGQTSWDVEAVGGASTVAGSWGGHCVPEQKFTDNADGTASFTAISWAALYPNTQAFLQYCDEAYGIISNDFLNAAGTNPLGNTLAQMVAEAGTLGTPQQGPSAAVTSIYNATTLSSGGAPVAFIAPNLIFGASALGAVVAGDAEVAGEAQGMGNVILSVMAQGDFSVGLLSTPLAGPASPINYLPGWQGGSALVCGFNGGLWYSQQPFSATGATQPIANGAGALVLIEDGDTVQLVGVMTSTSQAHIFSSADVVSLEANILTLTGNSPAVSRIYKAVLGRVADAAGLAYWSKQYQRGTVLLDIVAAFTHSAEFLAIPNTGYGTNATAWINWLYASALDRVPDGPGMAYWFGQITSGAISFDGAALDFSQSAEAIGLTNLRVIR